MRRLEQAPRLLGKGRFGEAQAQSGQRTLAQKLQYHVILQQPEGVGDAAPQINLSINKFPNFGSACKKLSLFGIKVMNQLNV